MTSPFNSKRIDNFPICPDCGKRHEQLPQDITLSAHDLSYIHTTLHKLLIFSQEKRIPLTVISGMVQTFHAEIMEELLERKRELMKEVMEDQLEKSVDGLTSFIEKLQESMKGGTDNGRFQEKAGRVEGEESSANPDSTGNKDRGGFFH